MMVLDIILRVGSHQICKTFFHLPKLANSQPDKESRDTDAQQESGQIKPGLSTQYAPAKPVDHTDHGVQGIKQTPLLWNDVRTIANWRHVQSKLNEERNDVSDVPVLNIQRGEPNARTKTREQRERYE